jgi:hypothetical protein
MCVQHEAFSPRAVGVSAHMYRCRWTFHAGMVGPTKAWCRGNFQIFFNPLRAVRHFSGTKVSQAITSSQLNGLSKWRRFWKPLDLNSHVGACLNGRHAVFHVNFLVGKHMTCYNMALLLPAYCRQFKLPIAAGTLSRYESDLCNLSMHANRPCSVYSGSTCAPGCHLGS